jgi:hypothetical protein
MMDSDEDLREKWCDAFMNLVMAARLLDTRGSLAEKYDLERDPKVRAKAEVASEDSFTENMKAIAAMLFEIENQCVDAGVDLIHRVRAAARRMDPWFLPCVLDLRHTVRTMDKDLWFATAKEFSRQWVEAERSNDAPA